MGLLFRYVLLRYLLHLVVIGLLMAGLYLAVDTPERLGQGWSILSRIPLVLSHVLPVAAGASLLTAFQRMRSSGALVTLRASGVSWRAIMAPVAVAGAGVAILEAWLSLAGAPAALAAVAEPVQPAGPTWVLHEGHVLHLGAGGRVDAWVPGRGPVPAPRDLGSLRADVDLLARVPAPERASTSALVAAARLEQGLGHDPRAEWVEVWTRLLMPCALLLVFLTCAVSVRREHPAWRSSARLVVAFVAGWLCLAAATQLFLNGAAPAWLMLALPGGVLLVLAFV